MHLMMLSKVARTMGRTRPETIPTEAFAQRLLIGKIMTKTQRPEVVVNGPLRDVVDGAQRPRTEIGSVGTRIFYLEQCQTFFRSHRTLGKCLLLIPASLENPTLLTTSPAGEGGVETGVAAREVGMAKYHNW